MVGLLRGLLRLKITENDVLDLKQAAEKFGTISAMVENPFEVILQQDLQCLKDIVEFGEFKFALSFLFTMFNHIFM